jgi:hypothetical protein
MACRCGQHKTSQGCAGARAFQERPEIWHKPKRRKPRVIFQKLCARGGCTGVIIAGGPKTLARWDFCSHRCSYLERLRIDGRSWCHTLTQADRRAGGAISGPRTGAKNHQRAIVAASERSMALLPADIVDILTPLQLCRLRVAVGRVWIEGRDVGVGARAYERRKNGAAA